MQASSTAVKCATVGVRNEPSGARCSSRNVFEPIEAATNSRPTSVADAAPTSA
jgi:hypothetical protein